MLALHYDGTHGVTIFTDIVQKGCHSHKAVVFHIGIRQKRVKMFHSLF